MFSLCGLIKDIPEIHIVDIGASPIEGQPIYQSMFNQGGCHVTGFEPNPSQYQELVKQKNSSMRFLPYAVGDGKEATLNICAAPGMTSLFEPDLDLLSHFHGFGEWGKVISRQPLTTCRLDDLDDLPQIDFLKLDVQGSELAVLENAAQKLVETLVIHVETLFIPFYKNQPLFGDIDLFLRSAGFMFHRFGPLDSRVFQPLILNNDKFAGLSQILWSDAVYVRPFVRFHELKPAQLLKIARMLHDIYGSYDLVNVALREVDRQTGSKLSAVYLEKLMVKA